MTKRWTVKTTQGAFIVYAPTQAAAKAKLVRQGLQVTGAKPRGYRAPQKQDVCPVCGSTDLFSGWYDQEGYAFPLNIGDPTPPGVTWQTSCNQCGWLGEQHKRKVQR